MVWLTKDSEVGIQGIFQNLCIGKVSIMGILDMEKICRGSGKGIGGKRGEMVKELDTLANEVINF